MTSPTERDRETLRLQACDDPSPLAKTIAHTVNEIIRDFAADGMEDEDLDATAVDVTARYIQRAFLVGNRGAVTSFAEEVAREIRAIGDIEVPVLQRLADLIESRAREWTDAAARPSDGGTGGETKPPAASRGQKEMT